MIGKGGAGVFLLWLQRGMVSELPQYQIPCWQMARSFDEDMEKELMTARRLLWTQQRRKEIYDGNATPVSDLGHSGLFG